VLKNSLSLGEGVGPLSLWERVRDRACAQKEKNI
jgi:hypothetical protein